MDSVTRKMFNRIRSEKCKKEESYAKMFENMKTEKKDNFLSNARVLMEEAIRSRKINEENDNDHSKSYEIKKDTPQFGDVRVNQESMLKKTVGENVTLEDDALKFYPNANDLTLSGKITSLNLTFQFRYNDPSGQGVYVWAEALQLTEENTRTIGKLRDAFSNWKDSITQDGDLMDKLPRYASKHE